MNEVDKKLEMLGIDLETSPEPMANYVSVQKAGNIWFFSGAGPMEAGRPVVTGRLGENLTTEEGYEAARIAAVNLLAVMRRELGNDFDKLEQVVKLQGLYPAPMIIMNSRR